jgi:uncharacterized protein (DUF924 family)
VPSLRTREGEIVIATVEDILSFWFAPDMEPRWFNADAALDDEIRLRFSAVYQAVRDGERPDWNRQPKSVLAAIIVLDQFPRNMFRDDARAFATDGQALALTKHGMAHGFDRALDGWHLHFFYMPLMHSEAIEDHLLLAGLGCGDESNAREHRETIARFGRYPRRNAALGRENTPEEDEFLAKR